MSGNDNSLGGVIRDIVSRAGEEKVSLGEIIEPFERRGFGSLLLIPSLLLVLPTGAIPGMPIVCGILMVFVTAQLAAGKRTPWIPSRLKSMRFSTSALRSGMEKALPWVERADRYTGRRLEWLLAPAFQRLIGILSLIIGLVIIPLGAIPFAIFLPALTVLFLALGLVARDGVLVAIGLVIACGFAALAWVVWL